MLTIIKQRLNKKILKGQEAHSTQPLSKYIFGYGANIDPAFFKSRITRHELVGVGYLENFELKFNTPCEYIGKGFGGVSPSQGKRVYGTVYRISDVGLELMDWLEWVPFNFYYRKKLPININGQFIEAEVYIPSHPRNGLYPPKGYLNLLIRGATAMNLPDSYIEFLKNHETKEKFELDLGFNLANPSKSRFLPKFLYGWHDKVREKICELI